MFRSIGRPRIRAHSPTTRPLRSIARSQKSPTMFGTLSSRPDCRIVDLLVIWSNDR